MNTAELAKALDLSKCNDIFDILGRMEVVSNLLQENQNSSAINAFLRTYIYVTKEVATDNLRQRDNFDNWELTEKLDIEFAKLFFTPLSHYLAGKPALPPWQEFFEYCTQARSVPFARLLLGINAHINGDLANALFTVGLSSYRDFDHINDLLLKVIPQVMRSLALVEHDIFAAAGSFTKNLTRAEFSRIVVRWRNSAWDDYQMLSAGKVELAEIHALAKDKGNRIIALFNHHHSIIDAITIASELNKL